MIIKSHKRGEKMSICIHGNLCKTVYEKTGYIHSRSCPNNCKYFEEKKKGEWIEHERTDLGEVLNHCIECSNCHIWFSKDKLIRNSYCPNCGAIMNTNLLRVSRQQD